MPAAGGFLRGGRSWAATLVTLALCCVVAWPGLHDGDSRSLFYVAGQGHCPNACSGHGSCAQNCTCHPGFLGPDCMRRICPHGHNFVDGRVAGDYEDYEVESDGYAECSNKGMCDRKTGECKCFYGFSGAACSRQACPHHCSGHGTCELIEDLLAEQQAGSYDVDLAIRGHYSGSGDYSFGRWRPGQVQACKCDPYYHGADCSLRMCPRGDDPEPGRGATRRMVYNAAYQTVQQVTQVQRLRLEGSGQIAGTYTVTFRDKYNGAWTSRPVAVETDAGVINAVKVVADATAMTFTGAPTQGLSTCPYSVTACVTQVSCWREEKGGRAGGRAGGRDGPRY